MNKQPFISPGSLAVLWRIVNLITRYEEVPYSSAAQIIKNSGAFGGTSPFEGGLDIGIKYDVISVKKGFFYLQDFAVKDLIPYCHDEEPNAEIVRRLLKKIIIVENFEWLVFFQEDAEIFKIYIPTNWQQLFNDVGLLNFDDYEVLKWWEDIFKHYRKYKEVQTIKVGDTAEKLSFDFEQERLTCDGHEKIDFYLKWVSTVSDKYGYDIGSIRSALLEDKFTSKDSIQIEVKGQQASDKANFIFYITDNEWSVALNNIDSYFFHCWTDVNVNQKSGVGPFIVPAKAFIDEMPINNGKSCKWVKCRLVVDLSTIAIYVGKT